MCKVMRVDDSKIMHKQSSKVDDIYIRKLVDKLEKSNETAKEKVDVELIIKSALYAKEHHGTQQRLSGEPYYSHPIQVASMVADYCFKTEIIITSILHDILEDTEISLDQLTQDFGEKVANNVESLTKFKIDQKLAAKDMVELLYHHKNKDVLLVKLFDRLHNMQTIKFKSQEKQKKIALETLVIFLTISIYLNLNDVEKELYILCSDILEDNSEDEYEDDEY